MESAWNPLVTRTSPLLAVAVIALLESRSPLGFAHGTLYVLPLLLTLGDPSRRLVFATLLASVTATVAGYFASPTGIDPPGWAIANRAVSVAVQAALAAVILHTRRSAAKARALRRSEDALAVEHHGRGLQLKHAQRLVRLGSWEIDVESGRFACSTRTAEIYGFEPKQATDGADTLLTNALPADAELLREAVESALAGERDLDESHRIRLPSGEIRTLRVAASLNEVDHRTLLCGVTRDVTDELTLRSALDHSEAMARFAAEIAGIGGWGYDLASGRLEWTDQARIIYGLDDNTAPRLRDMEASIAREDRRRVARAFSQSMRDGKSLDEVFRFRVPSGRELWVRSLAEPVIEDENVVYLRGALQDVTEIIEARAEAAEQRAQLEHLIGAMNDGFFAVDDAHHIIYANARAEDLSSLDGRLTGRALWAAFPELRGGAFEDAYNRIRENESSRTCIDFWERRGLVIEWSLHCVPGGVAIYFKDVTESRRSSERLKLLEAAIERINDVVLITEASNLNVGGGPRILFANSVFREQSGYDPDETIGRTTDILYGPKTEREILEDLRRALGEHQPWRGEMTLHRRDGTTFVAEVNVVPLADSDGRATHFVSVQRDVTARRSVEDAIREERERLRLITQVTNDYIWEWDVEADAWARAPELLERLGLTPTDAVRTMESTLEDVDARDRDRVRDSLRAAVEGGDSEWRAEYRMRLPDGQVMHVVNNAAIVRAEDGHAVRLLGGLADVTELRDLDARLHHAQKLESIGQLTGGVAHDFNNLLTIILGSAESLGEAELSKDDQELVAAIKEAAERGAGLTDSLLSFGRRQSLETGPLDVNDFLGASRDLLARALPAAIVLEMSLGAERARVQVDANRLQSSLLNLVINAMHAIGERGHVRITTSDRHVVEMDEDLLPGRYVEISVSDDGCGMPPEILERAMEPFFTTKAHGVGTGLGLASVFGFMNQSGGTVRLASEEGVGTTVSLLLPEVESASRGRATPVRDAAKQGKGERILIVEDDPALRRIAVQMLVRLGYEALMAEDGPSALEVLQSGAHVDLLFTDIVMPGPMNGRELADEARRLRPELKVLFTSGYADGAFDQGDDLGQDTRMLSKPYRREELASALQVSLGALNHA